MLRHSARRLTLFRNRTGTSVQRLFPTYDLLLFVPAFQLLNNIIQDAPKIAQSLCCFIPRVCAETPRLRELSNFIRAGFSWMERGAGCMVVGGLRM